MSIVIEEKPRAREKKEVPSIQVRLRKEVEALVKETSDKTGYSSSIVRNLAVLLGLRELIPILVISPRSDTIRNLYQELLELNSKRLENLGS